MLNLGSSLSEPSHCTVRSPSHMGRSQPGTLDSSLNRAPSRSQTLIVTTSHVCKPSWRAQPSQVLRGLEFLLTPHGAKLPRWAQWTHRIKRDNKMVFYCYHSNLNGFKKHKFIILEFFRSEVTGMVSPCWKQGIRSLHAFLEALRENLFPTSHCL